MCWCRSHNRTPNCGQPGCQPPGLTSPEYLEQLRARLRDLEVMLAHYLEQAKQREESAQVTQESFLRPHMGEDQYGQQIKAAESESAQLRRVLAHYQP